MGQQLRDLHRQITQLQAEFLHCIGEFDTTQGYELDEYRSTQSWLRHELRIHSREAAQMVGMARQLRQLPAVDEAFSTGEISQAHVAVLTRTARQIGADHVATSQQELLNVATTSDPERLRVAAQHLRYCVDPDSAGRDAVKAYEKRELSVAPTIYGMVAIDGMLDPTSGATVLTALDALTPPPRDDDPRTAGQRRADALTELCRRALDSANLPQVNGEKPHLLVTISYEALLGQLGGDQATLDRAGQLCGEQATLDRAGQLCGDQATLDRAGQLGAEPARLDWAGPISAADARMLACDCSVIPAVLDSTGEVLDIGRKSRIWPTAIARAIGLRDKTCRHVACDAPAQHCDIHHRQHWADGGDTSYANGVLACRNHHTRIHKYGANFQPDGQFTTNHNRQ